MPSILIVQKCNPFAQHGVQNATPSPEIQVRTCKSGNPSSESASKASPPRSAQIGPKTIPDRPFGRGFWRPPAAWSWGGRGRAAGWSRGRRGKAILSTKGSRFARLCKARYEVHISCQAYLSCKNATPSLKIVYKMQPLHQKLQSSL